MVEIVIIVILSVTVPAISFIMGKSCERAKVPSTTEEEARQTRSSLERAKKEYDIQSKKASELLVQNTDFRRAVDELTRERDTYKSAAASHEIKYVEPTKGDDLVWIDTWSYRSYSGTMNDNFESINTDVLMIAKEKGSGRVRLKIVIDPMSTRNWWRKRLKSTYPTIEDDFTSTFDVVCLPEIAVNQLKAIFWEYTDSNGDHVYSRKGSELKKGEEASWRSEIAPIFFKVYLELLVKPAEPIRPVVHEVKILETETKVVEIETVVEKIVERIVERPFIDDKRLAELEIELAEQRKDPRVTLRRSNLDG